MTDLHSLVDRLGNVSFFRHLPESTHKEIVFSGQLLHFPPHSVIFREGEPASGLYVLLDGEVHLKKIGLQGLEYIVYIVKSVVMFNEVSVIDGMPNPVTAVAKTGCTVWQISTENYQSLMGRYPVLGVGLLRILAFRNRVLLKHYEDLKDRSVLARTAKLLLALSQDGQQPINRRDHSNQQIAALAATVPEAVSRSIKQLKDKGVIECTRTQIRVISLEGLREIALIEPILLEYPHVS